LADTEVTAEQVAGLVEERGRRGFVKMKDVDMVAFSKWLYYSSSAARREGVQTATGNAPEQPTWYCSKLRIALNLQGEGVLAAVGTGRLPFEPSTS